MSDMNFGKRCIIKFCSRLGHSVLEIFENFQQVYEDNILSRAQVFRWLKTFLEGRESMEDEPCSGRPLTARTDKNVGEIRDPVRSDSWLMVRMIIGIWQTTFF